MGKEIKFSFISDGIGPHYDENKINASINASAPKIAIYAENGTGKTFFSRMFALSEKDVTLEDYNRLISIDKKSGEFKFAIGSPDIDYTYSVSLSQGNPPVIMQKGKKYLYHTFNSDYVNENIVSKDFSPDDGNVTGYILGKDNIDVSEEKDYLKTINEEIDLLKNRIDEKINVAKEELRDKKINRSLNEFKEINFNSVFMAISSEKTEDYSALCKQLNLLKNIPENIPSIVENHTELQYDFLFKIDEFLQTEFNKVRFDEIAMQKIKEVRQFSSFFKEGLRVFDSYNDNVCPFCSQELNEIGLYYINMYKKYFLQEEARILMEIEQYIRNFSNFENGINNFEKKYSLMAEKFLTYRVYIPELSQIFPDVLPKFESIKDSVDNIKLQLAKKKDDISNTMFSVIDDVELIKKHILDLNEMWNKLFNNSVKLQRFLDDSNNSRISLCRKICIAKKDVLIFDCKDDIEKIKNLNEVKAEVSESIKEKERKAKTAKRDVVIESLSMFLDYFFHQKYIFDEKTFGISFKGKALDKKAKDVLSDGEKSIVAFCYYLATTHLLVNTESDYDDIFFVIDDPISSLDFHYVYAVADIIRHLNNSFPQIKKIRYIVFTHNAEFMSILFRNKIPNLTVSMSKGNIEKMNSELLMPYEYHLNDIVCVANGTKKPVYTTPNSIRQVIETIMRFECPKDCSSESYVMKNPLLNKNSYIYSLMQDGSHGAVRKALPFNEECLKEACKIVVEFVNEKYPEQIKSI